MDLLREYVGGPKNRYKDQKFNLDLTYITPRVIAMAFPASGLQKLYRNSIDSVKQFLMQHHGKGYIILNLSGREIDESKLKNVYSYNWQDHQAPNLDLLFNVCQTASSFLLANSKNVIVVHCNHGKGRTGTVICCMMLYCALFQNAQLAMDFYAKKRFQIQENYGVTQPCQILYIKYFQAVLKNPKIRPKSVSITKIIFRGESKYQILYAKVKDFNGKNIITTKKYETHTAFNKTINTQNVRQLTLTLAEQVFFQGDIRIHIKGPNLGLPSNVATFSFNTAFLQDNKLVVTLNQLSPFSLRKTDSFSKDFEMQLQFKNYCKECPSEIQYLKKCNKCKDKLYEEQIKWKNIQDIARKSKQLDQSSRQKMMGIFQNNPNSPTVKKNKNPMQIQMFDKSDNEKKN